MKFPKPRTLTKNEYMDLTLAQPKLFHKLISDIIYPSIDSPRSQYIDKTITHLKELSRKTTKKLKINQLFINKKLYFMNVCLNSQLDTDGNINALVDTGAANSLIHTSVAERLGIQYTAMRMVICTATGSDSDAIKGVAHIKVRLQPIKRNVIKTCINFIVTDKLNGMDCIIGADFLMQNDKIEGITKNNIIWKDEGMTGRIRIVEETDTSQLERVNIVREAKRGRAICMKGTQGTTESGCVECREGKPGLEKWTGAYSHSIQQEFEDETLPNAEEIFADSQEIKAEILDKKISLKEGDYSNCPKEHLDKLMTLLEDFSDRFSKSKLDLEITDMYTADLETQEGRIVNQKCRRLPTERFEFAEKALRQLEEVGVISESDSEWRSNVVLVPKPQSGELRTNTKSDQMDKSKKTELFRICLDFRELNNILVFPKQVQFVNIEKLLYKLKNKVVVSMDISSAFFIIPIRKEDRHKTAFWVNDLAFEFNCLVMGLKSSPYHLKNFMNLVYSKAQFEKLKERLSNEERRLLPSSFDEMIIAYFDDCFVFADTYESLHVCFKL